MNKKAKFLSLCLTAVLLCGCIIGFLMVGANAEGTALSYRVVAEADGTAGVYEDVKTAVEAAITAATGDTVVTITVEDVSTNYGSISAAANTGDAPAKAFIALPLSGYTYTGSITNNFVVDEDTTKKNTIVVSNGAIVSTNYYHNLLSELSDGTAVKKDIVGTTASLPAQSSIANNVTGGSYNVFEGSTVRHTTAVTITNVVDNASFAIFSGGRGGTSTSGRFTNTLRGVTITDTYCGTAYFSNSTSLINTTNDITDCIIKTYYGGNKQFVTLTNNIRGTSKITAFHGSRSSVRGVLTNNVYGGEITTFYSGSTSSFDNNYRNGAIRNEIIAEDTVTIGTFYGGGIFSKADVVYTVTRTVTNNISGTGTVTIDTFYGGQKSGSHNGDIVNTVNNPNATITTFYGSSEAAVAYTSIINTINAGQITTFWGGGNTSGTVEAPTAIPITNSISGTGAVTIGAFHSGTKSGVNLGAVTTTVDNANATISDYYFDGEAVTRTAGTFTKLYATGTAVTGNVTNNIGSFEGAITRSVDETGNVTNNIDVSWVNGTTFYGNGAAVTGNVENKVTSVDLADNVNFYGTGAAVSGNVENTFTSVIADQANEVNEDGEVTSRPQCIYGTGAEVTGTVKNTIDGTGTITNFYAVNGPITTSITNDVLGGTITNYYGGGLSFGVAKTPQVIEVKNNFTGEGTVAITNYFGGHQNGYNQGSITTEVSNPNASFTLYYGGMEQTTSLLPVMDITNTISAGTFTSFYGSISNCKNPAGTVTNNISGGTFNSIFAGGGQNAKHYSVTNIISGEAIFNCEFRGIGYYAGYTTTLRNEVTGGTFNAGFSGSGRGKIVGATINEVEVAGSVTNEISNVTITGTFYGGSNHASAPITGSVTNTLTNVTIDGTFYGGSNSATLTGNITNTITGGSIPTLYGGCNKSAHTGNIATTVKDVTITTFYGSGNTSAFAGEVSNTVQGSYVPEQGDQDAYYTTYISTFYGAGSGVPTKITNSIEGGRFGYTEKVDKTTYYRGGFYGAGVMSSGAQVFNTMTGGYLYNYYGGQSEDVETCPASIENKLHAGTVREIYNGGSAGETAVAATITNIFEPNNADVNLTFYSLQAVAGNATTPATLDAVGGKGGTLAFSDGTPADLFCFDSVNAEAGELQVICSANWYQSTKYFRFPVAYKEDVVIVDTYSGGYGRGHLLVDGEYIYVAADPIAPSFAQVILKDKITVGLYFDKAEVERTVDVTSKNDNINLTGASVGEFLKVNGAELTQISQAEVVVGDDGVEYYFVEIDCISPEDINKTFTISGRVFTASTTLWNVVDATEKMAGASKELVSLCKAIKALGTTDAVEGAPGADANVSISDAEEVYNNETSVAFDYAGLGIVMNDSLGYTIYGSFATDTEYVVKVDGKEITNFVTDTHETDGPYIDIFVKAGSATRMMKIEIFGRTVGTEEYSLDYSLYASIEQVASLYLAEGSTATEEVKAIATEILAYIQAVEDYKASLVVEA